MKFLCVPCDRPMELLETRPPDQGSITLVYSCSACGYEMAMLTNPHETQVVGSLGVSIGPGSSGQAAAGGDSAAEAGASKCPFTGMVQGMSGTRESSEPEVPWTADARQRLEAIPEFLRPMAKSGIEKWAQDQGRRQVDGQVLDEAKHFFGM